MKTNSKKAPMSIFFFIFLPPSRFYFIIKAAISQLLSKNCFSRQRKTISLLTYYYPKILPFEVRAKRQEEKVPRLRSGFFGGATRNLGVPQALPMLRTGFRAHGARSRSDSLVSVYRLLNRYMFWNTQVGLRTKISFRIFRFCVFRKENAISRRLRDKDIH